MTQSNDEIVIYQQGGVTISRARAVLGDKTYAVANISSVSIGQKSPSRLIPVVLTVLGLGLIGAWAVAATGQGAGSSLACGVIGFIMAALGIFLLWRGKTTYFVRIASTSGEANAFGSTKREEIQPIVDAVNRAIIERSK